MVGGVVYGSCFGKTAEQGWFFPPLWHEPLERATTLLLVMVGLGVFMISLGLILNVINRMRSRDVAGGVLDKYGIVGIWFYWGALGLVFRYAVLGQGALWEVLVLLVPPVLLIVFREPILPLLDHRSRLKAARSESGAGGSSSLAMQAFEGVVDLVEGVMSYLANTISFVRVGAFALAHAGFMLAIFETEKVVRTFPAGAMLSVVVLVVGNILVVGLEGLVIGIQALRLEYYEFFSKFFQGQGRAFHPFGLR